MPVINIPFKKDAYQKLITKDITAQDFLGSLLYKNDANDAYAVIERILREYHFNDGGSPYIEGFEIANAEYNSETQKGRIWFKYRIDYYFGCEDRSAGTTFNEGYNFEIDAEALVLTIFFPEPVIRDTWEEF